MLEIGFSHGADDLVHHTYVRKSPQTLDTGAWRSFCDVLGFLTYTEALWSLLELSLDVLSLGSSF